jgi:hypothetical protein
MRDVQVIGYRINIMHEQILNPRRLKSLMQSKPGQLTIVCAAQVDKKVSIAFGFDDIGKPDLSN